MKQHKDTGIVEASMSAALDCKFLLLNISLVFTLPFLSVITEHFFEHAPFNQQLMAKWFIFWAVGIRLFVAGIKQASDPAFTAKKIFRLRDPEGYIIIRELGLANISLGTMGILSLINDSWRIIAAITGGLFFGLAALSHFLKKPGSRNETIALLYDALVFVMLLLFLAGALFAEKPGMSI